MEPSIRPFLYDPSPRYTSQRQQFGPPEQPEIAVLDYQSTQTKVIPMLSMCYALHFSKVWTGVIGYGGNERFCGLHHFCVSP